MVSNNFYRGHALRIAVGIMMLVMLPGIATAVIAPSEEWNRIYAGTNDEYIHSAQQTSDGGYILVGANRLSLEPGYNYYDAWLIKTNSSGIQLWNKTFGDRYEDWAKSAQQTSDGGYMLVGMKSISVNYAWLIKTDSSGNHLWNKTFRRFNSALANAGQQTSDGGYILVGGSRYYSTSPYDVYLIKTDSSGNELWNKTFGGLSQDYANSVQQTPDGGYILAGFTQSYGSGGYDAWLIKTDASGNELWNKTFGKLYNEDAKSVRTTSDGGYILAGVTKSYENNSGWIIKTDSEGNEQWNKTFEKESLHYVNSVQQMPDNGYVLVGNEGSYGSVYKSNGWLMRTDASGNELWNKTFGGVCQNVPESVQQTSDGGYVVAGYTCSYGHIYDGWLVKFSKDTVTPTPTTTPSPTPTPTPDEIEVGEKAPTIDMENAFEDAYARNGGEPVLGKPISYVSTDSLGHNIQEFPGANGIPGGVIIYSNNKKEAYYLHGAIWQKFKNLSDKSILGAVSQDELDAGQSPQGTTGRYSEFESGRIHWISDSNTDHPQKGQSFVTYGVLDVLYTSMGGTNNWLGFPMMDQEERDGYGYCEFEGGYIEWYGSGYKAIGNTATPTITITSPIGGDNWLRGTKQNIQWTYTGNPGSNVKIELIWLGKVVDQVIAESTPIGSDGAGSYEWTIDPATDLDGYQIRVTSTTNSQYSDTSDYFIIDELKVVINSPVSSKIYPKNKTIEFEGEFKYDFEGLRTPGTPPYDFEWFIDDGAIIFNHRQNDSYEDSWELEPPDNLLNQLGEHTVKLKVTDKKGLKVESENKKFSIKERIAYIPFRFQGGTLPHTQFIDLERKTELIKNYFAIQSFDQSNIDYDFYWPDENLNIWDQILWKIPLNEYQARIEKGDIKKECGSDLGCTVAIEVLGSLILNKGFESDNYNSIVLIQPENIIAVNKKSNDGQHNLALVRDFKPYGEWAHEIGHALYNLEDMAGDKNLGGSTRYWGLMGLGYNTNPPSPIILFNKNKAGWIEKWQHADYGTHLVRQINDPNILVDGILNYTSKSGKVKYYVFEGRHPNDNVYSEDGFADTNKLEKEEGIKLYQVENDDRIFAIRKNCGLNILCPFSLDFALTMLPRDIMYIDRDEAMLTALSVDNTLKIKIEKHIPASVIIFDATFIGVPIKKGNTAIPDDSNKDIDLHVINKDEKKIGMDYSTGEYYNELEGAHTIGNIPGGGYEWISVPSNTDVKAYIDLTPELKGLIRNDDSINVEVFSTLTFYDEKGNRKESVPISMNINSGNVDRDLKITLPINIIFLPPITTMEQFNLTNGSTLPIKFTARNSSTEEFIYDDTVNVTITNSTGHLITYFTNGTGTDSIRINTSEEQYIANLHTKNYALNVGETYAITVTFGEADALRGYEITYFTLVDGGKKKGKGN